MLDRINEKGTLEGLIKNELMYGLATYGNHHSDHEAWAVLQEELEELMEEVEDIKVMTANYWRQIRNDAPRDNKHKQLEAIYSAALRSACEAIQVAAMVLKADNVKEIKEFENNP